MKWSIREYQYRIVQKVRVRKWKAMNREEELLFRFPLNEHSLVFDVGGYRGEWAQEVASRYGATMHLFEPIREFAEHTAARFSSNPKVSVHPFGLSSKMREVHMTKEEVSSSAFRAGAKTETVLLKDVHEVLQEFGMPIVDLMKVNIEGGEYELLERLLETGGIKCVRNLLVQFHSFVPMARSRMAQIHKKLAPTHAPVFQCRFVWEHWKLKDL